VITLEEVLYDQPTGRLALVFELMDANLYELIRGRRHYLNPNLIKSYMWQLMKSLDHMHKKGIFHRDIKPENILIESTSEVGRGLKLADFGSCRGIYSKQPYTEYISTRWYRAPECLLTDGYYGPEMDLWGAGCVMFEITSLYPLFPGSNELDQINRIHKVLGTPSQEILNKFRSKGSSHISLDFPPQKGIGIPQLIPHASPDTIDLIVKLLKYDASERITAREAMRHPYFKDIRETEAKQQSDSKVVQAAGSTMPVTGGSSIAAGQTGPQAGTISGAGTMLPSKPLPNIVQSNTDAHSVKTGVSGDNHSQHHYLMNQKAGNGGQQSTVGGPQYKLAPPGGVNSIATGNVSSLPPIVSAGQGNTNLIQSKFVDPKTGRTMNQSSNQQKKRKKYKMNYAQQQRVAQNSESVMKAYGVPKIFGANNSYTGDTNGGSNYMRYDGSKMPTGVSGGGSIAGGGSVSGYGGGGGGAAGGASYGLYQQGNKISGQKKY
jgi:serine/threonine protein kinase